MKKNIFMSLAVALSLLSGSAWADLTQTQVSQLYVSILGRASEGAGNTYWQTDQGSSSMIVTANLMLNTEAAVAYFGPSLNDNKDFIEHIYLNTLGKTYAQDPDGIDYWVSELNGGKSKGEVIAALISAAQYPVNAGVAQDSFLNKIAVSDYCADRITDFTDTATFKGFIENVTAENSTVDRAFETVLEQAGNVSKVHYLGQILSGPDTIPYEQAGIYVQQGKNGEGYTVYSKYRVTDVQTDSDGFVISSTGIREFSVWQDKDTYIYSVLQANDGGYIMAGSQMQYEQPPPGQPFDYYLFPNGIPKGYETYLLKTDENGIETWFNVFRFANLGEDGTMSFQVYSEIKNIYSALDGGYILVADVIDEYNQKNLYLIKIDDHGSKIWSKKYNYSPWQDTVKNIIQAHDGGYIILGEFQASNDYTEPLNIFLAKIDESGNEIWNKCYEYDAFCVKIQKTTDGNYLLYGSGYPNSDSDEGFMVKIDTSGNEVWRQTYSYSLGVNDIKETVDGGYVTVCGEALIKIDGQGEISWEKFYIGELSYSISSAVQTNDGGFILFGATGGNQIGPAVYIGYDIWLIKTDSNGNEIWSRQFDLGGNEWFGGCIFQTSEGDYVLIGRTQVYGNVNHPYPSESIYFIKVDSEGYILF